VPEVYELVRTTVLPPAGQLHIPKSKESDKVRGKRRYKRAGAGFKSKLNCLSEFSDRL
jgi:hypothetical protein